MALPCGIKTLPCASCDSLVILRFRAYMTTSDFKVSEVFDLDVLDLH